AERLAAGTDAADPLAAAAAGALPVALEDVADAPLHAATAPTVTKTTTVVPNNRENVIEPSRRVGSVQRSGHPDEVAS
ncbi:MAG TPA: hypothetical protein VKH42_11880, partial [Vicinamibacterales bacterium]|nr:hypothetical protein [Vicinamibacterales bacterium]